MGLFDPANLAARRNLVNNTTLNEKKCFVLVRTLEFDGGGTEVEIFTKADEPFIGQLQTVFERAQDGKAAGLPLDMSDLKLVYDHGVTLRQVDRLLIGNQVYTVRNVYDNISTAMTNTAYVSALEGYVEQ